MFSLSIVLISGILVSSIWADDPVYVRSMEHIFNVSAEQTRRFIKDTWPIFNANWNTAMSLWPYDANYTTDHPNMLFAWGRSGQGTNLVLATPQRARKWVFLKDLHGLVSVDGKFNMSLAGPLNVPDTRMFFFRDEFRFHMVRNFNDGNWNANRQGLVYGKFSYDEPSGKLYVHFNKALRLMIDAEMGKSQQKNWSPFQYDYLLKANNKNITITPNPTRFNERYLTKKELNANNQYSVQLFVYSIDPHRIVYGSNLVDNYLSHGFSKEQLINASTDLNLVKRELKMSTVCLSEFVPSADRKRFWFYGNPHGGTPSVLINTKYGPRYLTVFHSQGKYSIGYILTYYMGAYLFEPTPPFRITHLTADPIFPNAFYNESFGWSYRTIDYIVFPTGLVVQDDSVYVSLGKNDRSGWMLEMTKTGLVDYMTPVESKVTIDKFHDKLQEEYTLLHPSHR
jgi:hypothetical protein